MEREATEVATFSQPTGGIPDPDQHDVWLVCPWPTTATFCEIVRHFVSAYVWRLEGDTSTARQLAYFEGYQAALTAAPTHELTHATSWRWHDELMMCIDICITQFSGKRPAEQSRNTNVPRSHPARRLLTVG